MPRRPGRESVTGRVALSGQIEQIPDNLADPEFTVPHEQRLHNIRSLLGVPLLKDGAAEGVFVLGKPYFDPTGLVLAEEQGDVIGWALAGFGPDAAGTCLDPSTGIVCVLGVLPDRRRRGIGAELLRRCEDYLRGRGAQVLLAGPMAPRRRTTRPTSAPCA